MSNKIKRAYITHLRPSIDITYEHENKECLSIEKELEKILKSAIKNNKILKSAKTKLKYISMGESYVYKRKHSKDNNHPNFISIDNV